MAASSSGPQDFRTVSGTIAALQVEGSHEREVIAAESAAEPRLQVAGQPPRLTAVRVSGSSDVSLHGVHDDSLELSGHGSGNIRGDGAVHQLRIDVNGSGDLDQLPAKRAA